MSISKTPDPPYYTVIFTSKHREDTTDYVDYATTAERMFQLAQQQSGYLGHESTTSDNLGITVSYWRDLDSISKWKLNGQHLLAQKNGRTKWYSQYMIRIARVERQYSFDYSNQ